MGYSTLARFHLIQFLFRMNTVRSMNLLRNVVLQNNNSASKVIYYPLYGETPTSWSEGHLISPFDSRSSTVPTYDMFTNYNYVRDYLYDLSYLKNNLNNSHYYDFLNSVGIQYIIFHNDRTRERDSTLDEINLNYLQSSSKLDKIYDKKGWYVFTIINSSQTSPIRSLDAVALTNNSQQVYEFAHPTVGTLEFDTASQRISSDHSEPPIHQTSDLPSNISANRSTRFNATRNQFKLCSIIRKNKPCRMENTVERE